MNKNILKIIVGVLIVLNFILLVFSTIGGEPVNAGAKLFGLIIGWALVIFVLQKAFTWAYNKGNIKESSIVGLISALVLYILVFSFFTFIAQ